ncbi:MAG: NrsF family protein [Vicinamibacteraceae bacterium]
MKTDQLIDALSTNLEPVPSRRIERTLIWAVIVGGVAAFCVMLVTLALRADGGSATHLAFLAVKVCFGLAVISAGVAFLITAMYPGREGRTSFALLFLPFVLIGLAALTTLLAGPSGAWAPIIRDTQWALCLLCIPLFAIIPFAVLVWALRKGAPTNLTRTGAVAGFVAGALGAVAYAFHCADDSLPFIAVWYSGPIALCGMIGAKLGPRLLRW